MSKYEYNTTQTRKNWFVWLTAIQQESHTMETKYIPMHVKN